MLHLVPVPEMPILAHNAGPPLMLKTVRDVGDDIVKSIHQKAPVNLPRRGRLLADPWRREADRGDEEAL